MMKSLVAFLLLAAVSCAPAYAAVSQSALRAGLQTDISQYLATRAKAEHISAISLSVYLPGAPSNINVTTGTTQYAGAGSQVTPENLYQIGSVTKSFTSMEMLALEADGKLTIDQTVGRWLPQYPAWKSITIRRLLNMTSDIPTYDDDQSMLAAYAANPTKNWSRQALVAYVYPQLRVGAGFLYSNTAYLLAEMIIERASGNTYTSEIRRRFLENPAFGLQSTYYEPDRYPPSIADRLVSGYFASTDADNRGLAPILDQDVKAMSLSWAQSAGAIVATPQDVTHWARDLFSGSLLTAKERKELTTLVSQKTGKPITSAGLDEQGFGLGVAQFNRPGMGTFWFYEGETLGYRMAFAYYPKSHVAFAVGLNSQPTKKEDHVGKLMQEVYSRLQAAGKI